MQHHRGDIFVCKMNIIHQRGLFRSSLSLMQYEYEMIVKSGLDLQIDCPDLALSRHMLFNDMTDDEFVKIASINIESLNNALRNIPKDKIRIHICWEIMKGLMYVIFQSLKCLKL